MFYNIRFKKKYIYLIFLIILILLISYLIKDQVIQYVFQSSKEEVIYYIDTEEKIITFTFDVLVGTDYVDEILEILDLYNIKSTFFLTGKWIKENNDLTKIIANKHELGSLSYSYTHLTQLRDRDLYNEFELFRDTLENIIDSDIKYFRPPFGEYDERTISLAGEQGHHTILWSIESKDWITESMDEFINNIIDKAHPGGIIVFRTCSKETVKALPIIIKSLWEKGYSIVSLDTAIEKNWRKL